MIELIITIGLFSVGIYILILFYLSMGIIRTKTPVNDELLSVSVIVAAHNESQNIADCLDSLLKQDYPEQKMEISNHVLEDFTKEEEKEISEITNNISSSMSILIEKKLDLFSSKVNQA